MDRVFSPYRPDSDATLLAEGLVTVDACAPEMAEVIEACAFFRELSGGYFTASPWGRFDPSGYVKGWAVERAAGILAAAGSASHLVNGGGDVQCAGGRPDAAAGAGPPGAWAGPRAVADRHRRPARPGRLALVVAASGLRGGHVGHRRARRAHRQPADRQPGRGPGQPHRGRPQPGAGRRVRHRRLRDGPDLARDWLASLDGYEAYAITETGETWQTAGFAALIDPG